MLNQITHTPEAPTFNEIIEVNFGPQALGVASLREARITSGDEEVEPITLPDLPADDPVVIGAPQEPNPEPKKD